MFRGCCIAARSSDATMNWFKRLACRGPMTNRSCTGHREWTFALVARYGCDEDAKVRSPDSGAHHHSDQRPLPQTTPRITDQFLGPHGGDAIGASTTNAEACFRRRVARHARARRIP